ncbi:hypothetical protein [Wenjunlia tyrosinilytica]|uniref:Uncharacterized protein n=1 Tax=Wenjunlia tyrosinilytica TaxID=1544741 RepID=A0A917ZGW5_9ACTN|nr:hypothetical protein [Wenjunlia tyrosinilytica]GGO83120.1 hypothetical protein GCM10012280_11320 [Wenjunlia tyrosinilytica]
MDIRRLLIATAAAAVLIALMFVPSATASGRQPHKGSAGETRTVVSDAAGRAVGAALTAER